MNAKERREHRRCRLIDLIDQKFDGQQIALANAADIAATLVSRYVLGTKGIGEDMAAKIERNTGYIGWFLESSDSVIQENRLAPDIFEISVYGIEGSMGPGAELVERETVIDSMRLTGDWFRQNLPGIKPEHVSLISGRGNSMEPTFSDGDLLLIHTAIKAVDIDGIYALRAHSRLFIKTVRQRMDGSFEISSDNPSVKTVDILNGSHEVEVIGRVVWAWNGKRL